MSEEKAILADDKHVVKATHHPVIWALGAIGILAVGGAIALAILGKPVPESVVALGSASVGALAGLLAPLNASK